MLRISIKIVNILLDEISKEEENMFLLGDFNISFLNYNDRNLQMISLTHLHPTARLTGTPRLLLIISFQMK